MNTKFVCKKYELKRTSRLVEGLKLVKGDIEGWILYIVLEKADLFHARL